MVVVNSKNTNKFKIVLLFFIVGNIYTVESNAPITLNESDVDAKTADESLGKIKSNEALPMILFKYGRKNQLYLPKKLKTVRIDDGKIINGTQFTYKPRSEGIFFCPNEKDANEKCLVRKTFEQTERFQCASEPTPVIESGTLKCGLGDTGTFYRTIYQICEDNEMKFGTKEIPFYRICYNKDKQKTLFTIHPIQSPELLKAKLLLREREVEYRMMEKNEFHVFSITRGPDDMDIDETSTSPYQKTKPGYKWRNLIPSEDMALGLWRKTTFQRTNTAQQHEKLISLWDKISEHVRDNAIKNYIDNRTETFVFTGVFSADPAQENDDGDQLSNLWVKLVFAAPKFDEDTANATHGLAILMNNFVGFETSDTASLYSEVINGFCDQDLCIDALSDEFKSIKGRVRCCLINQKILDLFNTSYMELEELHIHHVNVTEDQETLNNKHGTYFTNAQAIESIGEIRPNEILPMVLFMNCNDFTLHVPRSIHKIETKNRRIVNGSEFSPQDFSNKHSLDKFEQQMFFCPAENSNEKCLAPRTFGRFEPLQCTEQAIPKVKQLSANTNKCGVKNSGTLYEVVYEICPAVQPYAYRTMELKFYEFCYDTTRKIILYTRHKIMSTHQLLNSELLFRERDMKYEMMYDTKLPLSNYEELVTTSQMENKSDYGLQKLVPSEDMAFASWIKSTYNFVNVALQHKSLISLWTDINHHVTRHLFSIFPNSGITYAHSDDPVYTGVLYKQPSASGNEINQTPELWFKVIHTEKSTEYERQGIKLTPYLQRTADKTIEYQRGTELSPYQEGIVILMNNFLIPETDQSKPSENTLKTYCEIDLCAEELRNKFHKAKGQIRCCSLTMEIARKLGIPIPDLKYSAFTIPNTVQKKVIHTAGTSLGSLVGN